MTRCGSVALLVSRRITLALARQMMSSLLTISARIRVIRWPFAMAKTAPRSAIAPSVRPSWKPGTREGARLYAAVTITEEGPMAIDIEQSATPPLRSPKAPMELAPQEIMEILGEADDEPLTIITRARFTIGACAMREILQ